MLIAAARLLRERGALGDAVVVLAGDAQGRDGYKAQLEDEITTAGLQQQVRLVGHVADMPAAYATAHLAVVASTQPEAFGRVGTELQIMGCPVIATAIGAPPETVLSEPAVAAGERRAGWFRRVMRAPWRTRFQLPSPCRRRIARRWGYGRGRM